MRKIITLLLTNILMISCNSQIDLETLKYDNDISNIIGNLKDVKEDQDPIYGLSGYRTDNLQQYKFGEVSFSKYEIPNGNAADYSDSYILVNNFEDNKFLGITLSIVNEEEENKLVAYLIRKYGTPESREVSNEGKAYVWYNNNQWILLKQDRNSISKNRETFLTTRLTIVKKGTRVENSSNKEVFTILESFSLAHPKKEQ